MKSKLSLLIIVTIFFAGTQSAIAGQVIGQLTDPCNMGIDGYLDILSASVERDDVNLTFVMEMRGNIPAASSLPDYNDTLTYIWLVDADNNPNTGQNPGGVGTEFNVRVVISQNPAFAGGYIDITGAMQGPGTGGTGTVQIIGNTVRITINRSQIASVRRFHWRSDAWIYIGGSIFINNGVTPESGLARVSRYGVLTAPENDHYQVGDSNLYAELESDPGNPVINLTNVNGGNFFVCLPLERKYPDQDNVQINAQATGHSGPGQLRMLSRFDVSGAETAVTGYAEGLALSDVDFYLDSDGVETGPVPTGVFLLKLTHDYHIFAADTQGQGYCTTFAQIVINQVDPPEQKAVWVFSDRVQNEQRFAKHEETLDLASYGLEFGVQYRISIMLDDRSEMPQASVEGGIFSDSTMMTSIDVANIPGDIDGDWKVDLFDFARFADSWLTQW
jgi:hypothetical protein